MVVHCAIGLYRRLPSTNSPNTTFPLAFGREPKTTFVLRALVAKITKIASYNQYGITLNTKPLADAIEPNAPLNLTISYIE
jgi:hypothetical protein